MLQLTVLPYYLNLTISKKQFLKIRCFLTIFFKKNLRMNHINLFILGQKHTMVVAYFDLKVRSLMTSLKTAVNIA
jgi:hypothetical protein